jgi:ribonuclease VapC
VTQRRAFVLDAFALLAHLQDEPAAAQVEDILRSGDPLYMSSINLGEVFYRTARTRGIERAEGALALIARGPVDVVDPDRDVVLAAAWLKARHPISYADCFAAALAQRLGATLLTGDRDFARLEDDLTIEWLPE